MRCIPVKAFVRVAMTRAGFCGHMFFIQWSPSPNPPMICLRQSASRAPLLSGARIRFRIQSCFSTMTASANSHTVDTSERLSKLRELMNLRRNAVKAIVIPSEDQRKWDLTSLLVGPASDLWRLDWQIQANILPTVMKDALSFLDLLAQPVCNKFYRIQDDYHVIY